jgi:hypothetical protein
VWAIYSVCSGFARTMPSSTIHESLHMRRLNHRGLAILLAVLSIASAARAQGPRYQMVHEGRHWSWFAREDQFRQQKTDIAALMLK